jgi:hypothetical protein
LGLFIALLNTTPLFAPFGDEFDKAFFASGGITDQERSFQQWTYGVVGATMVGWGIFMFFIVRYAFPQRMRWAWNCILTGVVAWYVIDSSISAYHGVGANVLLNTVILVLIMVPLAAVRSEMNG